MIAAVTTADDSLQDQPEVFWTSVAVFPTVIRNNEGGRNYSSVTATYLRNLPITNLRLLCERLSIPTGNDADHLAETILASDPQRTLHYLYEFSRGSKGKSIIDEYGAHFTHAERARHSAALRELGGNARSTLKPFTQLVLLYLHDPNSVHRAYFRHLWRRRPTKRRFEATPSLDQQRIDLLVDTAESLAEQFKKDLSDLEVTFFGRVTVGQSIDIFLFKRRFGAVIQPDYLKVNNVHNPIGWIVFGIERNGERVVVKGKNNQVAATLWDYLEKKLKISLSPCDQQSFDDYDMKKVEAKLLGDYPASSELTITKMAFRRSLSPNHSPLVIAPALPGLSIRGDLRWLNEKELIRIRTFSDLELIGLRYAGTEVEVTVSAGRDGRAIFQLDDTSLSPEMADMIADAFQTAFGIPLDTTIDPRLKSLGAIGIFRFILEAKTEKQAMGFHAEAYKQLVEKKFLKAEEHVEKICKSLVCKGSHYPDATDDACPACQGKLTRRRVKLLIHDETAIRKFARKALSTATGWTFAPSYSTVEKHRFYSLFDPARPDEVIRVFFADHVSRSALKTLERSLQPVLVVHTSGDYEHALLDKTGIAHVGFADALAAAFSDEAKVAFGKDCRNAIAMLVRGKEERALRAASESRKQLGNLPSNYEGHEYEIEIFNILRSVFPYTERWGGGSKPDGFCSLVYFEDANLRNPKKFNWTYDAKYTGLEEGYDLDRGEKRKVFDYVLAAMDQDELQSQGNELNAHVIITNHVAHETMVTLGQYLRKKHRLGKDHANFKLVCMTHDFLSVLYDTIRAEIERFRKRWPLLAKHLSERMRDEKGGYVLLQASTAEELCKAVLGKKEIETPADGRKLREEIEQAEKYLSN